MIYKVNTWYNSIEEPWRMLVGLGICMPVFILLAMDSVPLILAGWLYGLLLIFVRIVGSYKR